MARKTKQDTEFETINKTLAEIKQMLAERKHIDEDFLGLKHEYEGNGKPGFKQVRDKITAWEVKINAVIALIFGDIIFRIIQLVY